MAATDLALANRVMVEIGGALLTASLSENPKLDALYEDERDMVLAMHPWNFALKRARVTAAGLLDCSAKTVSFVENAGADTITDSGSEFVTKHFESGDIVSCEGSSNNNATYGAASVTAGTLTLETHETVTAEVLVNNTDLKLYALTANGRFKFPKPSDCLRVFKVQETTIFNEPYNWTKEGRFIVTDTIDENSQLRIVYIKQVTDPTLFDSLFEECFVAKLCAAMSMADKENMDQAKFWLKHFDYRFKQATQRNAFESNRDTSRAATGWQSAGR